MVGFVLPSGRLFFFGELTDLLELKLREHDYRMLVVHSRNSKKHEEEMVPDLLARGVDGLFWIPLSSRISRKQYQLPRNFPLVILDRPDCCVNTSHVVTDNREASRALARKIQGFGHQRIAVLNASSSDRSMKDRLLGLRDVFGKRILVREVDNDPVEARAASLKLMRQASPPRFLLALSEPLAMGALVGIKESGREIPRDVSFAAFDDFPMAKFWSPAISVVRQDMTSIASLAVRTMLEQIAAPKPLVRREVVPAEVQWRDSVLNEAGDFQASVVWRASRRHAVSF